jgi:hypothetical protein
LKKLKNIHKVLLSDYSKKNVSQIELNELLNQNNIKVNSDIFEENDIVVIPPTRMSTDDIEMIKEFRVEEKKKIHIVNQDKIEFQEFRCAEFILGMFIINSIIMPLVMSRVDRWISRKQADWKKRNDEAGNEFPPPKFKLEIYEIDKKNHVKIEGDAETARKVLESIDT